MNNQTPNSCIVYGPEGCGKTTKAQVIANALGLSKILDNWSAGAPVPPMDTLVLTNADNPAFYYPGRVLTFDQAMRLVVRQEVLLSAHSNPQPDAEQRASAWLGQAGLYRSRFDAVHNCEQSVTPVSFAELFELASKEVSKQIKRERKRA